jgi:lipopolysaccharide export system ATP-binding protein
MTQAFQALKLAKSYGPRKIILDVSICVKPKQIVGLLGPNGAGKTTCFYMMIGLIKPDAGQLLLDDKDISNAPMHLRAQAGIGYLPQENSIFRRLSVSDNILSILELRKDLNAKTRKTELNHLLEEFHLTHVSKTLGVSLSGGERRRAEIARALAMNPSYILLDEPFAGVDPISVQDIQHMILHLKSRGLGVLITDHNVRETLSICEMAYIVSEGRVLASGSPAEIVENTRVKEVYLGKDFSL